MTDGPLRKLQDAIAERPVDNADNDVPALSTGSTLLNLAIANNPFGGLLAGKYYLLVGDTGAGKTFLSMTLFAEALLHPHFRKYRLIYDNIEDGCLLDLESLFNKDVAESVEPPAYEDDGSPKYSKTLEEFYFHLDDAISSGEPFIYVLDSMDALTTEVDDEDFSKHKKAARAGRDVSGSYGVAKAKLNSQGLRRALRGLRETGSILLVLSQTRANLGMGYAAKTRAGGQALSFYATVEIWASIKNYLKKTVRGKERQIGVNAQLKVKKNRITGQLHEVAIQIYPSYGIDDIGGMVDFLVSEGWWPTSKNTIEAKELGLSGSRRRLIRQIEDGDKYRELQRIVGECWQEIQEATRLDRKPRYRAMGAD